MDVDGGGDGVERTEVSVGQCDVGCGDVLFEPTELAGAGIGTMPSSSQVAGRTRPQRSGPTCLGGVEEADALLDRCADEGDRRGTSLALAVVGAHPHAAEPERRHVETLAELTVLRGSGLRDVAAEGLERDVFGLGPATAAGVQSVDRGHLVGGELEVEDVDVLGDPLGADRFRDDGPPVLEAPADCAGLLPWASAIRPGPRAPRSARRRGRT